VRPETLQLPSETLLSFDEPPPLSSSRRRRLTHPDSLPAATFRVTDRKTNASRWRTIWCEEAECGNQLDGSLLGVFVGISVMAVAVGGESDSAAWIVFVGPQARPGGPWAFCRLGDDQDGQQSGGGGRVASGAGRAAGACAAAAVLRCQGLQQRGGQ